MKIPSKIIPFLTYSGYAEEVINYYILFFPCSKIEGIEYFKEREREVVGKVKTIAFKLMDKLFMALDVKKSECHKKVC